MNNENTNDHLHELITQAVNRHGADPQAIADEVVPVLRAAIDYERDRFKARGGELDRADEEIARLRAQVAHLRGDG